MALNASPKKLKQRNLMKTYKIEIEYPAKGDEYRTDKGSVVGSGATLQQAKEQAEALLERFKNHTVLFEYEVK
jgi:hypothetical protein